MTALHTLLTIAVAALGLQSYPPAYPRAGASKMFENDRVVVWHIAWLKGQPSPLHRHIYDLAGLYYSPGDRMIIAVDGSKRPVSAKAGEVVFQQKGITHVEEGTSDVPLRAVFVELKNDAPTGRTASAADGALPPFAEIGARQLLDNDRVTIWTYAYGFGNEGPRHRHPRDAVVVWIEGTTPHAVFVPAGTAHTEEQAGVTAQATVFEIK